MMWPTALGSNGITAEFTYFFVIFLSVFQVVFIEHVSLFFLNKCTISDRPIWASTAGSQEMFVDFFFFFENKGHVVLGFSALVQIHGFWSVGGGTGGRSL